MAVVRHVLLLCLFCVFITVGLAVYFILDAEYNCTSPTGEPGYCISIKECPTLDAMALNKDRSEAEKELLLNSKCGVIPSVRLPKVCCVEQTLSKSPMTQPIERRLASRSDQKPFDVDQLLPSDGQCGVGISVNRITRGTEADLGEFPWTALIFYSHKTNGPVTGCGASLISKRYAITAAHCVLGRVLTKLGKPLMIRLGEHDRTNNTDCEEVEKDVHRCADKVVDILIDSVVPHPDFKDVVEPKNDIALIRLKEETEFTEFIQPICLPKFDVTLKTSEKRLKLTAAGWGHTEDHLPSAILLFVTLPYVHLEMCEHELRSYPKSQFSAKLWDKQICVGGKNGKDTCQGDSGGPLMHKLNQVYNLAGIVSYGPSECGASGVPGVYTKVYPYVDWIRKNIKP